MTKTPLEALERLWGIITEHYGYKHTESDLEDYETIRQLLTGAGEPVGWQWRHNDPISGKPYWHEDHYRNGQRSEISRPLYTAPQTPTPDPDTVTVRREDLETLRDFVAKALNAGQGNTEEIRRQYQAVANVSQALQVKP